MLKRFMASILAAFWLAPMSAHALEAPDALIKRLSNEIIDKIKSDPVLQAGDFRRLSDLVDATVMAHVNFQRMTSLSVGRNWRNATSEQQKQLMTEFRALLLRTYSGALSSVNDQSVRMKPLRADPADNEVIVRSEVVQPRGEPIQLDYRMEKTNSGWKIYDVNVLGVWLVENYRNQFSQEIAAKGVDGLIKSLSEKNRTFAQAKTAERR